MRSKSRIGSIVIRCYEFDRMVAFWQDALGYKPKEPPKGGWVILRDPTGRGPNVQLPVRMPLALLGSLETHRRQSLLHGPDSGWHLPAQQAAARTHAGR